MWESCDTRGILVFLHALWHSWLLHCVVLRVVKLLCVMLYRVGVLACCVVMCGCMLWSAVSGLLATRSVMPFCVASFRGWWLFWFVVSCSFRVALCSALLRGVVSRYALARPAAVRCVRWCCPVVLGPSWVRGLLRCVLLCRVLFCEAVLFCVVSWRVTVCCVVLWCGVLLCVALYGALRCNVLCCVLLCGVVS